MVLRGGCLGCGLFAGIGVLVVCCKFGGSLGGMVFGCWGFLRV